MIYATLFSFYLAALCYVKDGILHQTQMHYLRADATCKNQFYFINDDLHLPFHVYGKCLIRLFHKGLYTLQRP